MINHQIVSSSETTIASTTEIAQSNSSASNTKLRSDTEVTYDVAGEQGAGSKGDKVTPLNATCYNSLKFKSNYLQKAYRRLSLITLVIPFLGSLFAIALLWYFPLEPIEVGLAIAMYALTILGIEVGFHRLFSHRAFQTTTAIRITLAILGSMAAQGGVIFWVAHHRCHHQYTDRSEDPHSPHLHGDDFWGRWQGFAYAHGGWILEGKIPNSILFAKDLIRDSAIAKVNQLQPYWVLLGLAIPTVLGGILTWSWLGALQGFLWGGLVRIFLGQQIINSTNSICHLYGGRPFNSGDCSTNNIWLAIPSFGQSWHNNHHAFPSSAIAGLEWWHIDPGNLSIWILEKLGLAWNVKRPTAKQIKAKKVFYKTFNDSNINQK